MGLRGIVREKRERNGKKKRGKRERKGRTRDRVSTYIYPPPSNVRPRTSRINVGNSFSRCDVPHCNGGRE
jgi:hypothetical protein